MSAPKPPKLIKGVDYYLEGTRFVFTSTYHLKRGFCCHSRCRHCPYGLSSDPRFPNIEIIGIPSSRPTQAETGQAGVSSSAPPKVEAARAGAVPTVPRLAPAPLGGGGAHAGRAGRVAPALLGGGGGAHAGRPARVAPAPMGAGGAHGAPPKSGQGDEGA